MVLVIPTKLTWHLAPIMLISGTIIAFTTIFLNSLYMQPYINLDFLPNVDHNPYFLGIKSKLTIFNDPICNKLALNGLLLLLFFLQHSFMARSWVKKWLADSTNN